MAQRRMFIQEQLDEAFHDLGLYPSHFVQRTVQIIRETILASRPVLLNESELIGWQTDSFNALVAALQSLPFIEELELNLDPAISRLRRAELCKLASTSTIKTLCLRGRVNLSSHDLSLIRMIDGKHLKSLDLSGLSMMGKEEPEIISNVWHFFEKIKKSDISFLSLNLQHYRKLWQSSQICLGLAESKLKFLRLSSLESFNAAQFEQLLQVGIKQMLELKEIEINADINSFRNNEMLDSFCSWIRSLHPIPLKLTLNTIAWDTDPEDLNNLLQVLQNTSVFHLDLKKVVLGGLSDECFFMLCNALRNAQLTTLALPHFDLSEDKLRELCSAISANPNFKKIHLSNEELFKLNPEHAFNLFCTTIMPDGHTLLELTDFDPETYFYCRPEPRPLLDVYKRQLVQQFIAFSTSRAATAARKVKLDLSDIDLAALDDNCFDALCKAIRHSTCLDTFKYSNVDINQLNPWRLKHLFSSLAASPITTLDLENTNLNLLHTEASTGIESIFDCVKNSRTLTSLNLQNNRFEFRTQLDAQPFITAMEQSRVKKLKLDLNDDSHLSIIRKLLAKKTLTHLTANKLGGIGPSLEAFTLFCQAIRGARIHNLDFGFFNINYSPLQSELIDAINNNFYITDIGDHPELERLVKPALDRNKSILQFINTALEIADVLAKDNEAKTDEIQRSESCLQNITKLLPQIPPEADDLAQKLMAARDELIHETGAWYRNHLEEKKAIKYWMRLPRESKHFAPARAEAFTLVYNNVYEQNEGDKLNAFIEALPFCFDENQRLIPFPDSAQRNIDTHMLAACGVPLDEYRMTVTIATPAARISILKLVLLNAISQWIPALQQSRLPKIKSAVDIVHLSEEIAPIWKSACKHTPALIEDAALRQSFIVVSELAQSAEPFTLPRNWDEYKKLHDRFIPSREQEKIIPHLLSKSSEQVDLFFSQAKQYFRIQIAENNKVIGDLNDDQLIQQACLAEDNLIDLQKIEKAYARQRKLLARPAAPKDDAPIDLINNINSVNQYMKKRAKETRSHGFLSLFFGFAASDYYARRQHWQTVLDALARAQTDGLDEAYALIEEGITRFGGSGRSHYAYELRHLKLSLHLANSSYMIELFPHPPQMIQANGMKNKSVTKLINRSRQVYAEQDAITGDAKNLHAATTQTDKSKHMTLFRNNLSFYKIVFNNSDAFLNKDELSETELVNAR